MNVFVMVLSFIIFGLINSYAGETSRGGTPSGGTDARPMTSKNAFAEQFKNSCPPALSEWVDDDFSDKKASLFGFVPLPINFPSEAKACNSIVQNYEDQIKKSGKKANLSNSEAMSSYLAERYKQISPNVNSLLSRCNNLSDGKDKVVKARYYMAASKVEAVNSTVLDEMAYIDSLVPQDQALKKMDCNAIFPFPQIGRKCEDYKRMLNGSCKQSQEDRLNAMVQKTKSVMETVDQLEGAYRTCKASRTADQIGCENLGVAIKLIKNDTPWIDGIKFQNSTNQLKKSNFWKESLKDDIIKKGITAQLSENRRSYAKEYDKNIEVVKCLTNNPTNGKAACSFEDAREYISQLPDLVEPPQTPTQSNREFSGHIDAEKCLIERGMDRAGTKKIIDDSIRDIVITGATVGLAAAPNFGLKFIKGMSTVSKLRTASFVNSAVATANLSVGVRQAITSCSKMSESLLKFNGKQEVLTENICPESSSKLELAHEANTSCLTDALLTSATVWPFVKGLKVASQFSKFSSEDLLKFYKDPGQRARVEKILAKNGKLNDVERLEASETLLGRELNATEKDCVITAHNVAAGKSMRMDLSAATSISELSAADLLAKKTVLSACGISVPEVALLMRAGITGSTPEAALEFIRKSSVKVLGKDLTPSQVDAVWESSNRSFEDKIKILKKAGFSEDDATRIAKNDLNKLNAMEVKAVSLGEQPKETVTVLSAKPPPAIKNSIVVLADAFERGDAEKIQAAYKLSRAEALQAVQQGKVTTTDGVLHLTTKGLNVEESVSLLKGKLTTEADFKDTLTAINGNIKSNSTTNLMEKNYNAFKLQELKVKVMEEYYGSKYKSYGSFDKDKFWDAEEEAAQVYSKASEELQRLSKLRNSRWP